MTQRGVLAKHRLRHLEGISLRNLTLSKAQGRPRGRTIDDESLPSTFATRAKLLAAEADEPRLEHSRSSIDLKSAKDEAVSTTVGLGSPSKKSRKGALRRRSTLNWSNETPAERQRLLEEAIQQRRLDTFFSLHRLTGVAGEAPVYISETRERSMNPDFQYFNLKELGPTSAEEAFILRVWTKPAIGGGNEPILLLEIDVYLQSLRYIGKTLDNFHHPFAENSVIFYLLDGAYTSALSLPGMKAGNINGFPRTGGVQPSNTSSFDALMQLNNQAECIDDALRTRDILIKQLETLIRDNENTVGKLTSAKAAWASTRRVGEAASHMKLEVSRLKHHMAQVNENLKRRHETMKTELATIKKNEVSLAEEEQDLLGLEPMHSEIKTGITSHMRRISQTVLDIYPIQPIENRPLCFTIRELHLPNASTFSRASTSDPGSNEAVTAAALGHVASITNYLALKFSIPLPYPISACGSTSTIFDPLTPDHLLGHSSSSSPSSLSPTYINSNKSASRTAAAATKTSYFPSSSTHHPANTNNSTAPTPKNSPWRVFTLSQRGSSAAARFAWAVYLLNKDLEELMSKCSLKIVDPRNTLANLKYLLTVLASGKGEMPARKAGHLKGVGSVVGGGTGAWRSNSNSNNSNEGGGSMPPSPPLPPLLSLSSSSLRGSVEVRGGGEMDGKA